MGKIAALLAASMLLAMPQPAAAEGRSAVVRVAATILSYVKVANLVNPAWLDVSAEDVSRGYVDVDGGTSLTVVSNSGSGYLVTAMGAPGTVARVELRIAGQAGGERLRIAAAPFARSLLRVGYRLYLEPGVAAGRHSWPVAIGVSRE